MTFCVAGGFLACMIKISDTRLAGTSSAGIMAKDEGCFPP